MLFSPLAIAGAFLVEIDPQEDERGLFARTFCEREFAAHGLAACFVQCNTSHNPRRGTLRGLHYQAAPHREAKLVRCTAGAIYDVMVDLRAGEPGFRSWLAVDLTAENRRAVYIPPGVAHGFQTTADNSEVFYQMSEFYHPELARGVRWDDPALRIEWPVRPPVISAADAGYPDLGA